MAKKRKNEPEHPDKEWLSELSSVMDEASKALLDPNNPIPEGVEDKLRIIHASLIQLEKQHDAALGSIGTNSEQFDKAMGKERDDLPPREKKLLNQMEDVKTELIARDAIYRAELRAARKGEPQREGEDPKKRKKLKQKKKFRKLGEKKKWKPL
jgi:hypothetical protein